MKPFLCFILLVPGLLSAQTAEDIFRSDVPLVFFGADFTKTQFTKSEEFTNKSEILRFFEDANNLMKEKMFCGLLKDRLEREEVLLDFSAVSRRNAQVRWEDCYSDNINYLVPDEEIETMITALGVDQSIYKDHIGLVFIEENFCKTKKLAYLAIVFFRVNDMKPLLIKQITAKPVGYGFLASWGNTVNAVANQKIGQIKKEMNQ